MNKGKSDSVSHQAERQRKLDLIYSACSVSRMNNTKWAEAINSIQGLAHAYRVKLINEDDPSGWGWLIDWRAQHPNYIELGDTGPVEFVFLEWMEVQPIEPEEIEKRLQSFSVPFEWQGPYLRITGYVL